jgi:colicin import membrane protein
MQSTILVAVAIVVLIITLISISRAQEPDPDLADIPETLSEDEKKKEILAVKKLLHNHASEKVKKAEAKVVQKVDKIKAHVELKEKMIIEGLVKKQEEMKVVKEKIVASTEKLERMEKEEAERKLQEGNQARVKAEEAEEARKAAEAVALEAEKAAEVAKQRIADARAEMLRKLRAKREEQQRLREEAAAAEEEARREALRAKQKEREALLAAQEKAQAEAALAQEQLQEEQRLVMEAKLAEAEEERLAAIEEAKEIERQAEERQKAIAEAIEEEEARIAEEMEEARRAQAEAEAEEAERIAEQEERMREAEEEAAELLREAKEQQAEMDAEAAEILAQQQEEIREQEEEARILAEEAQAEYEELEREQKELEEELRIETEELERLRREELEAEKEAFEAENALKEQELKDSVQESIEDNQRAEDERARIQAEYEASEEEQKRREEEAADLESEAIDKAADLAEYDGSGDESGGAAPAFKYFCVQKPPELIPFENMNDEQINNMYSHVKTSITRSQAKGYGYADPEKMKVLRGMVGASGASLASDGDGEYIASDENMRKLEYLQPRRYLDLKVDDEGMPCEDQSTSCGATGNTLYRFPVHSEKVPPGQDPTWEHITETGQPNKTFQNQAIGPSIEKIPDPNRAGEFKYVWSFSADVIDALWDNKSGTESYQLPTKKRSRLSKMVDAIFPKTEGFLGAVGDFFEEDVGGAFREAGGWFEDRFKDAEDFAKQTGQQLGIPVDQAQSPEATYVRAVVDETFCNNLDGYTWKDGMCEHDAAADPEMEKIGNCATSHGHIYTYTPPMPIDPNLPMEEQERLRKEQEAEAAKLRRAKEGLRSAISQQERLANYFVELAKAKDKALEALRKDCKYVYNSSYKDGILGTWERLTTPTFKTELFPVTNADGTIEYKSTRILKERARYDKNNPYDREKILKPSYVGPQACLPCDPFTKEWLHILEEPSDPGKKSCPTEEVRKVPCEPFMSCSEYTAKMNARTRARHDAIEATVDANKAEVKRLLEFAREESRARKRYEAQVQSITSVTSAVGKARYETKVKEKKEAWDKARKDYNTESEEVFKAVLKEATTIPRELHYCKTRWLFGDPNQVRGYRKKREDSISKKYFGNDLPYDYGVEQKELPLAPTTYAIMIKNEGVFAGESKTGVVPVWNRIGSYDNGEFQMTSADGKPSESKISGKVYHKYKSEPWQKDGKVNHSSTRQQFVVYAENESQTYILDERRSYPQWKQFKSIVRDGLYKLEPGGKLSLIQKQKAMKEEKLSPAVYKQKREKYYDKCARKYYRSQYNRNTGRYERKETCKGAHRYRQVDDTTKPYKKYTFYNRDRSDASEELYNFNDKNHSYTLIANFDANDIWLVSTNGYYYSVANNRKTKVDSSLYCKVTEPVVTNTIGGVNALAKFLADCLADDAPKDGCGGTYSILSQLDRASRENERKYGYGNNLILEEFNESYMKQIANKHYDSYK